MLRSRLLPLAALVCSSVIAVCAPPGGAAAHDGATQPVPGASERAAPPVVDGYFHGTLKDVKAGGHRGGRMTSSFRAKTACDRPGCDFQLRRSLDYDYAGDLVYTMRAEGDHYVGTTKPFRYECSFARSALRGDAIYQDRLVLTPVLDNEGHTIRIRATSTITFKPVPGFEGWDCARGTFEQTFAGDIIVSDRLSEPIVSDFLPDAETPVDGREVVVSFSAAPSPWVPDAQMLAPSTPSSYAVQVDGGQYEPVQVTDDGRRHRSVFRGLPPGSYDFSTTISDTKFHEGYADGRFQVVRDTDLSLRAPTAASEAFDATAVLDDPTAYADGFRRGVLDLVLDHGTDQELVLTSVPLDGEVEQTVRVELPDVAAGQHTLTLVGSPWWVYDPTSVAPTTSPAVAFTWTPPPGGRAPRLD